MVGRASAAIIEVLLPSSKAWPMLRHRLRVMAPVGRVIVALRGTGLVTVELTDADHGLIHIGGAAGYFTHKDANIGAHRTPWPRHRTPHRPTAERREVHGRDRAPRRLGPREGMGVVDGIEQ